MSRDIFTYLDCHKSVCSFTLVHLTTVNEPEGDMTLCEGEDQRRGGNGGEEGEGRGGEGRGGGLKHSLLANAVAKYC